MLAVLGSVTPPGRLRLALEQAVDRARGEGRGTELIDLAALRIPFADGRSPEQCGGDTAAVVEAMASASSLVLATPVYRGSMTGALKNLLDHVPVSALEGKVVGLAAMGGSPHHYLGADRHLRDVLAFFGAVPHPVPVYLTGRDFDDGAPTPGAGDALDALFSGVIAMERALRSRERSGGRPLAAAMVA